MTPDVGTWSTPELMVVNGGGGNIVLEDARISPNGSTMYVDNAPSATTSGFVGVLTNYKTLKLASQIDSGSGSDHVYAPNSDASGDLFFVDASKITCQTCGGVGTIYEGNLSGYAVTNKVLVAGVTPPVNWINIDASILANGNVLFYSQCRFPTAGRPPNACTIICAAKQAPGSFSTSACNQDDFTSVNAVGPVKYVPYVTPDLLEIVFTHGNLNFADGHYEIMTSFRSHTSMPFPAPSVVAAAGHNCESGSVSPDGHHLYMHCFTGGGGAPQLWVMSR